MKLKHLSAIALVAMALMACDEDTGSIGGTLTSTNDDIAVSSSEYDVLTRSYVPDSVYSYNEECYLGRVIDPETGALVTCNFMFQLNMMESNRMPASKDLIQKEDGVLKADSCEIVFFFDANKFFGDTLVAMKLRLSELDKPVPDGVYYSNFDPAAKGYVRSNGLKVYHSYSYTDMPTGGVYLPSVEVPLNEKYVDKNGRSYSNYGSYIINTYYEHPEFFKNSFAFVNNVCPGFYVELSDGLGLMAKFSEISFRVYFHLEDTDKTRRSFVAASTPEVMQTITVDNDKESIRELAADNSCTYLKTPAGIFTEVELPVDAAKEGHLNDSILSATVSFPRLNNYKELSNYSFAIPQNVMLVQKDSLVSFFEKKRNYNNIYSFYTTLSKTNNYSFSGSADICNLIVSMYNSKKKGLSTDPDWVSKHPNWNKAILVPVSTISASTTASSTTTSTVVTLVNEMGMTCTRLIKGTAENPLKIRVVYAKFKE